jgi:hypothetical protein
LCYLTWQSSGANQMGRCRRPRFEIPGQTLRTMPDLACYEHRRDRGPEAAVLDGVEPEGPEGVPLWRPPDGGLRPLAGPDGPPAPRCQGLEGLRRGRRLGGRGGRRREHVPGGLHREARRCGLRAPCLPEEVEERHQNPGGGVGHRPAPVERGGGTPCGKTSGRRRA